MKGLDIMLEDIVIIDIPKMIVIHLHCSMIDIIPVAKTLEMVRPMTVSWFTFLVTITWTVILPLLRNIDQICEIS